MFGNHVALQYLKYLKPFSDEDSCALQSNLIPVDYLPIDEAAKPPESYYVNCFKTSIIEEAGRKGTSKIHLVANLLYYLVGLIEELR